VPGVGRPARRRVPVVVRHDVVLVAAVRGAFAVGEPAGPVAALEERHHRVRGRVPADQAIRGDADTGDAGYPFTGGDLVEPADAGHPHGAAGDVAVDVDVHRHVRGIPHRVHECLLHGAVVGVDDRPDNRLEFTALVGAEDRGDFGAL